VEDRISRLEDKTDIKENIEEYLKNWKAAKGICKNSVTPPKDQPANHGRWRRRRGASQRDT
jgi:hypothetical protein